MIAAITCLLDCQVIALSPPHELHVAVLQRLSQRLHPNANGSPGDALASLTLA